MATKKNPTDATLRNNRARVREIESLKRRLAALELAHQTHRPLIAKLEKLLSL